MSTGWCRSTPSPGGGPAPPARSCRWRPSSPPPGSRSPPGRRCRWNRGRSSRCAPGPSRWPRSAPPSRCRWGWPGCSSATWPTAATWRSTCRGPPTATAAPVTSSWEGCSMDSVRVDTRRPPPPGSRELIPLKVLVAGGFGAGKTTFVGAISEIPPLTTEQHMTALSVGVDDTAMVPDKTTTTVAMDFGRITVDEQLILYLFGTPGQSRFWFMWDELARGAVGAVVLVDLRRVDHCFPAIDYFEDRRLPFVVAANAFPGTDVFPDRAVRDALALPEGCPLVRMDAREPGSCMDALVVLVEHALARSLG